LLLFSLFTSWVFEVAFFGNICVSPENGLTTLARFLYKNEKFLKNNGKQIAVNTIRQACFGASFQPNPLFN